jgi:hypothetical protein
VAVEAVAVIGAAREEDLEAVVDVDEATSGGGRQAGSAAGYAVLHVSEHSHPS